MKVVVKPIEMISHTDKDGIIKPSRFKIDNKEGEELVYKILRIQDCEKLKIAGVITLNYTCIIAIQGIERICVLRYTVDKCKWELYKI